MANTKKSQILSASEVNSIRYTQQLQELARAATTWREDASPQAHNQLIEAIDAFTTSYGDPHLHVPAGSPQGAVEIMAASQELLALLVQKPVHSHGQLARLIRRAATGPKHFNYLWLASQKLLAEGEIVIAES